MYIPSIQKFNLFHLIYIFCIGFIGWVLFFYFSIFDKTIFPKPIIFNYEFFIIAVFCILASFLSIKINEHFYFVVDSSFYIAIRFTHGTKTSLCLILLILTINSIYKVYKQKSIADYSKKKSTSFTIAYILYSSGLPILVMLFLSYLSGNISIQDISHWKTIAYILFFTISVLITYYSFSGLSIALFSINSKEFWSSDIIRIMLSELALLPFSISMVLSYKYQGSELFLFTSALCVWFNFILYKWSNTRISLKRRIVELSILNSVSKSISNSFNNRKLLFENIAKSTLKLVKNPSFFFIGLVDKKKEINFNVFDEKGVLISKRTSKIPDKISSWVIKNKKELILNNFENECKRFNAKTEYNFSSWLGVPLLLYNQAIGIISLQNKKQNAYTKEHLHILKIIADQVVVAIENLKLYQLATTDSLTGLVGRYYFEQRLSEEWARSKRYGNPFTVGMLDIDYFKRLNDVYGHQVGDRILYLVAKILNNNMRSFDIAARYGGEEFIFMLPRTPISDAKKVAERIRENIENMVFKHHKSDVKTTVSIGLASSINDLKNIQELIGLTDEALYKAKFRGRNQVILADSKLPKTM